MEFSAVLLVILGLHYVDAAPTLQFPFGTVQGSDLQSQTARRPVFAYYGIPFAEPPVGPLRFKAPVPYAGRGPNNVVSGPGFKASCMQDFPGIDEVSEDCLHLNVFAPGTVSQAPRKVMVWVHGGGYMMGDAVAYVPTDLVADHDVIVVSLHYRLGYFGFLATGQRYGAGANSNNGLRDQLMALQWVKDNIASFGGDASDVTIFGESAGSSSVSLLTLSPYSRGLFTKVIMQSGTMFSPWAMQTKTRSESALKELADRVGCLSWYHKVIPNGFEKYHAAIVTCLQATPAPQLTGPLTSSFDMRQQQWAAPYVDGDVVPDEPATLLANEPYLRSHGVLDRSYIVGTTNLEGYSSNETGINSDNLFDADIMKAFVELCAGYYFPMTTNSDVTNIIDFVYTYPRGSSGQPSPKAYWDLFTDVTFVWPTVDFVTRLASVSPATPIYHYLFDHFPELDDNAGRAPGTPHATDLVFLFDKVAQTPFLYNGLPINLDTPEAQTMKDVYRGTLAEFAKTGNPSRSRSGGSPSVWPRFDLQDRQYMALSPRPQAGSRVFSQRMSLWQDYLPEVATNIFTGRGRDW